LSNKNIPHIYEKKRYTSQLSLLRAREVSCGVISPETYNCTPATRGTMTLEVVLTERVSFFINNYYYYLFFLFKKLFQFFCARFYTYSICHFYHNFYQKLNRKKIEISFPNVLLYTNKLPKQPTQQTQMAMTIEQLTMMVEALTNRVEELEKLNGVVQKVVDVKKAKKEKKEKKEVDPNKPKKTSGYLIYSNSVRNEVKEKLIADGGEGKPKEVVQAIAAKWKEIGDEEKAFWNEKAKTPVASEDEEA